MFLWGMIALFCITLFVSSFLYLTIKLTKIFLFKSLSLLILLIIFIIISLVINYINASICFIYLTMFFGISDIIFFFLQKFFHFRFNYKYIALFSIILTIIVLFISWKLNHNVSITKYNLTTDKNVENLKIAFFADSHIGTTFDYKGFQKHMEKIKDLNPDVLFIVGDYVDDETKKIDMIKCTEILGKLNLKYGIYFVLGNHDKGYYGAKRGYSENDVISELEKNHVKVLRDESIFLGNDFYCIGRKDYSVEKELKEKRKTVKNLTANLDKNKYLIVLDHQPVDYKSEINEKVDLVLSGHTHGGQLFPFNNLGKWIKAVDMVYGHKKISDTNFIVTSGISSWAVKFKLGTKSEIVLIDINRN